MTSGKISLSIPRKSVLAVLLLWFLENRADLAVVASVVALTAGSFHMAHTHTQSLERDLETIRWERRASQERLQALLQDYESLLGEEESAA